MIRTTTTCLLLLASLFAALCAADVLRVEGSDTMFRLNQRLAEAFSATRPGSTVAVEGGGTRIGVTELGSGAAQIAAASRRYTVEEVAYIRNQGLEAYEIPVALDALVIAVNASNPVAGISLADLKRIYLNQIRNWKELGGPDLAIQPLSRDANSGTYGLFQAVVLGGQEWGLGVRFMPSTVAEVEALQKSPGAIAFGGIPYFQGVPGVKILSVSREAKGLLVAPSEETVRNKTYPLWRYLFYYTNGSPRGEVRRYIDFVRSDAGQKVVRESGFFTLK